MASESTLPVVEGDVSNNPPMPQVVGPVVTQVGSQNLPSVVSGCGISYANYNYSRDTTPLPIIQGNPVYNMFPYSNPRAPFVNMPESFYCQPYPPNNPYYQTQFLGPMSHQSLIGSNVVNSPGLSAISHHNEGVDAANACSGISTFAPVSSEIVANISPEKRHGGSSIGMSKLSLPAASTSSTDLEKAVISSLFGFYTAYNVPDMDAVLGKLSELKSSLEQSSKESEELKLENQRLQAEDNTLRDRIGAMNREMTILREKLGRLNSSTEVGKPGTAVLSEHFDAHSLGDGTNFGEKSQIDQETQVGDETNYQIKVDDKLQELRARMNKIETANSKLETLRKHHEKSMQQIRSERDELARKVLLVSESSENFQSALLDILGHAEELAVWGLPIISGAQFKESSLGAEKSMLDASKARVASAIMDLPNCSSGLIRKCSTNPCTESTKSGKVPTEVYSGPWQNFRFDKYAVVNIVRLAEDVVKEKMGSYGGPLRSQQTTPGVARKATEKNSSKGASCMERPRAMEAGDADADK